MQVLAEARILEETLDISKLEGTKLAEIMGISEKQIKQLVSIQKADFKGMKESGVFQQIGFGREQEAIEGLFKAIAQDDLQSNLLETVSAVYAAHSLYSDKMANIQDMKTTNPLAALINAGLTENNSGLTQAQINAVSLMIDLATGNKKANQIGIDDYKTILEQQGLGEAEIKQIELLQKLSGGDFNYETLEEAGVFTTLGLSAAQIQKLQIAYDLMDQPITFANIAESGMLDDSVIKTSGSLDLMVAFENDKTNSKSSIKNMGEILGLTEEQLSQIEGLYDIDGAKGVTVNQLKQLANIVGFELSSEEIRVLTALEKLPKGVNIDYINLVDSGLFEAIGLSENEKSTLERVMLETSSGKIVTFDTLRNAGLIDSLDEQQLKNIEVAMKVQENHPELFNNVIANNGFMGKSEVEAAVMAELSNDEYTYLFYDMRLLGRHYSNYLEKEGASEFGFFKLQAFESKEAMGQYYSSPDNGYVMDGLCFGFEIKETGDDDFELEIMGNDFKPEEMAMLPIQAKEAAEVSQAVP